MLLKTGFLDNLVSGDIVLDINIDEMVGMMWADVNFPHLQGAAVILMLTIWSTRELTHLRIHVESDRECVRQVHNFNRNWPYQFAWCSPARVKGSHSWTKWWPCSVHWPACVPESCILAVLPVCTYWLILLLALLPSLSPPPPHTPMDLYYMQIRAYTTCPSLISLTISVDTERHVYLLTRLEEEDLEKQT